MPLYSGIRQEHWLRDKRDDGGIVILDDESMWEIEPSDRFTTVRWLRISTITVEQTRKEAYAYLLMNTMEGETARANYLGQVAHQMTIVPGAAEPRAAKRRA